MKQQQKPLTHAMQKILYLKQEELSHKNWEQKSKGLTVKLFTRINFHPQTQFALLLSNGYKSLSKQMNQLQHFFPVTFTWWSQYWGGGCRDAATILQKRTLYKVQYVEGRQSMVCLLHDNIYHDWDILQILPMTDEWLDNH